MASDVRKWMPLLLVAAAGAASALVYDRVPPTMSLDLTGLLPFEVSSPDRSLNRGVALFLMPAVMLVMWAAFRAVPTRAGERIGRRLFRNAPAAVTATEQFERFGTTFDTIVLGIVLILSGAHAAILLAAIGYPAAATRVIPLALGASLVLMGNVMPRLRPNWVAGLRTAKALEDPQLWRRLHVVFGRAFVVAGLLTIIVGFLAPKYALMMALAGVAASCVAGFIASSRYLRIPSC